MRGEVHAYYLALELWADISPDDIAVTDDTSAPAHASLTWKQLHDAATAWAYTLSQYPGSRPPVVMMKSANRTSMFIAWIGTLLSNATIFPVSTSTTDQEMRQLASLAQATHLLSDQDMPALEDVITLPIDSLHDGQGIAPEQFKALYDSTDALGSALLLSSGTTGQSKIVMRDLEALYEVAISCAMTANIRPEDVMVVTTAVSHSYMVDHALMAAIVGGTAVHLMRQFDPLLLARRIHETGATILPTVPFVIDMLTQTHGVTREDLASLENIYTAGTPLPAEVASAFEQRFGLRVGQIYGATEFGSVVYNDPTKPDYISTLAGEAMYEVQIRIVDRDNPDVHNPLPAGVEGQVAIAATSMFTRYLGEPSAPLHDGFFLTGDLGVLDEQSRLRITGRLKLLVDIAGQKVNLIELESLLAQYPGVRDVIVMPVEVTATVSRLKALVVWKDQPGDLQALRDWARPKLASYKLPRLFESREDFPRTPTGKIMRQQIRP